MDLQLNIKTGVKTNKHQKSAKNSANIGQGESSGYGFVSKPTFVGKTLARKRPAPTSEPKTTTFSLLNANKDVPPIETASEPKKHKSDKSLVAEATYDFPDEISKPKFPFKPRPNKLDKKSSSRDETSWDHRDKQPRNDTDNPKDGRKKSIHTQVHNLFKNNPEIPKIGQRYVKPINEKVFSGRNFEDLNLHSYTIANLEKNLGLKQLTVVQQKATPVIFEGRDVLVRSQTGSGKTLAYALPIIEALGALRPKLKRHDGVKALVIVPTRELALQTYELFIKLMRPYTWVVPGYLIGGENRKAEKARIRKGFNILIGTPGRVCDHLLHTVSLKLHDTRCLVLDEADRLLDMGYEKDVASIVQALQSHKRASGYDPMALVRNSIKGHIHFGEEGEEENLEDEEAPQKAIKKTKFEDAEVTESSEQDEKSPVYLHELSNVMMSDKRQTILLSATLTKAVETLAGLTMENPVFIDSSDNRATLIADSVVKPETIKEESIAEVKQEDVDDDLEIVAQEKSDDEDDDSASREESDANSEEEDGDDSDDEDGDSSDDESNKKEKTLIHRGLAAFTGIKSLKKVESPKKKKREEKTSPIKENKEEPKPTKKLKPIVVAKDESDSDSDYDIFSAVKIPKKVETEGDGEEEFMKTEFVTDSGLHSNPFQNALHNAIAQDEMVIPASVTQTYIVTPMKLRLVTLSALIIERCVRPGIGKMLVFMGTQDLIDYHCEILSRVLTGKPPKQLTVETNETKKNRKKHKKNFGDDNPTKEDNDESGIMELEKIAVKEVEEVDKEKKKKDKKKNKNIDVESIVENIEKKKISHDDEDYDGMDLAEFEERMKEDKKYVSVEFFQLHGSMDQRMRTEVFKTFRAAKSGVLLCTDVAARGLDLPHVDCIVQYTGPISATDYVHRVGRTARAGNVGTAIMMLLPSEVLFVRQLEERRIRLHQEEMEPLLSFLVPADTPRSRERGAPDPGQLAAAVLQSSFEDLAEKDADLHLKGCKAFTSWLRFYSTYPREARAAFDRKALHAGHAACALALRDTPRDLARAAPRQLPVHGRKENDLRRKVEKRPTATMGGPTSAKAAKRDRLIMVGEFESGLETTRKKKKA